MIEVLPKPKKRIRFSPLRYPGGKAVLYELLSRTLTHNRLHQHTYVEPFAGGAGAGLGLLLMEQVSQIVLNDLDQNIYAFWWSLLNDTDRLVEGVLSAPLNIEEWRRQNEILRNPQSSNTMRGFATFYLNRTNHSGVLNGGPIGGLRQDGKYKLDARFNREELARRIQMIARYRGRIRIENRDGVELIKSYIGHDDYFFYIDPPYFEKGSSLYLNSYKFEDHRRLSELLNDRNNEKWLLSYDDVDPIRNLYINRKGNKRFSLHYQAHSSKVGVEMMVMSDSLDWPVLM